MCLLGTFSHHTVVNEASCIKIDARRPARQGVPARLRRGDRAGARPSTPPRSQPGDTVAVVGIGGIGANAIQGAKLAGAKRIVAIDPLENKREKAMEFGATHTAASMEEALPLMLQNITWGTMANKVIMTMGVGSGALMAEALALTSKRGRVVVTNIHPAPGDQRDHEPPRPDPHGEAGRRVAVRLGQPSRPTSRSCSGSTARASSTSTAS